MDKNIKVLDDGTDAEIVFDAADDVATEIIDRPNRAWPETPGVGGALESRLLDDALVWCHHEEMVCKFGDLGTLAAA